MDKEKNTLLSPIAEKACLNSEKALAVAEQYLKNSGKNSRKILPHFEKEIKAYQYEKVFIWVIGIVSPPKESNLRMVLYIEVITSEVKFAEVNLLRLKAVEEKKIMKIDNFPFRYTQGRFSPLKYGNIMTRAECEEVWNKAKLMYKSKLASDGYVVYERPVPAIDRKTPFYIIAFRMVPYKVEALVVYPNHGKVTTHVYAKVTWRKMLRKIGMGIVRGRTEIIIAPEGFVSVRKER